MSTFSTKAITRIAATGMSFALVAGLTGCGSTSPSTQDQTTVGFIMVGSPEDAGYNEAVADGAAAVEEQFGDKLNIVTADQVPENNAATQTMQSMVDRGADIIFATSYGYYQYALDFAESHPDVIVMHQGGYINSDVPENFGTYWGQAYDPVSLGGMAAGAVTTTNKLGFIYAFPIAQTVANINAFALGAQKTNPDAEVYLVNTSNWCDPLKQKQAVDALLSQDVDVFSQHQDCQATVIQATKAAGKHLVGYHYDAKGLYPEGWLTGSAWNWGPIFSDIISTVGDGSFPGSKYNGNFIGSFATGDNPLQLASFGESVPQAVREEILAEQERLSEPGASTFTGPIYCQDGSVLVPEGQVASQEQLNTVTCLVKGVVGTLPEA